MARAGMSDEEMTAFLKEMFCVDSAFTAADLFNAAELAAAILADGVHEARPQHHARNRAAEHMRACKPTYLPSMPPRRFRPHLPTYPPRLVEVGDPHKTLLTTPTKNAVGARSDGRLGPTSLW